LRSAGRWIRTHRRRTAAIAIICGFALLNAWAYRHAWAMTHYSSGGDATIRPEEMSVLGRARVLLTGVNLPRPANDKTPSDVDLSFETHRLEVPGGIELEAWYVPRPNSRAVVVLFHGYASSKSELLPEARAFHDFGCAVLLVDFRGSGGSTGNTTTLGVFEAADVASASALARRLASDKPIVLFGGSMGAAAVLRAIAHEGIAPAGIVIECPFDRLLGTVEHRFTAMGLPSFPVSELLVFWGGIQHGMNGFAHNPRDYAARVTCPVLLMHGADDKRVSVADVEAIYAGLAGEKQLEIFPDVGHEPCCRARPDLWSQHVGEFLNRNCLKTYPP
jgi:hypothetical protein